LPPALLPLVSSSFHRYSCPLPCVFFWRLFLSSSTLAFSGYFVAIPSLSSGSRFLVSRFLGSPFFGPALPPSLLHPPGIPPAFAVISLILFPFLDPTSPPPPSSLPSYSFSLSLPFLIPHSSVPSLSLVRLPLSVVRCPPHLHSRLFPVVPRRSPRCGLRVRRCRVDLSSYVALSSPARSPPSFLLRPVPPSVLRRPVTPFHRHLQPSITTKIPITALYLSCAPLPVTPRGARRHTGPTGSQRLCRDHRRSISPGSCFGR
jgi:hypothetical protein